MKLLNCPFCGARPVYDEENQTVHCPTVDCAIGDFYINPEEWNKRALNNKLLLKYLFDTQTVYIGAEFDLVQEHICRCCGRSGKKYSKVNHKRGCEVKKLLDLIY